MKLENITKSQKVIKKRGYHDACGMAHGLELLGDRWALFIVRELMLGARRFGDLRADLPGISAYVLTQRLSELEANGIVVRSKLPPPASVQRSEERRVGKECVSPSRSRWWPSQSTKTRKQNDHKNPSQ